MASYGYVMKMNGNDEIVKVFKEEKYSAGFIRKITYESLENSGVRPELDSLLQTLTAGDELVTPALDHLGSTMNELILTIESCVNGKIKVILLNSKDRALVKNLGGITKISKTLKLFVSLQYNILKRGRLEGIKRAKKEDAKLSCYQYRDKKYKGRVGATDHVKLKIAGELILGKSPTDLATKHSISRGSVYNYYAFATKKHPSEVIALKKLSEIEGFEKVPNTTYSDFALVIVDAYMSLITNNQKEIREATEFFKESNPELTTAVDLQRWLMSNKLSEYLKVKIEDSSKIEGLNVFIHRYLTNLITMKVNSLYRLMEHVSTQNNAKLKETQKGENYDLLVHKRLFNIMAQGDEYQAKGIEKLSKKVGLKLNFMYLDCLMGRDIDSDCIENNKLTICHYMDY